MLFVGLTGNYGMGKSAVLSMFRALGAVSIDADEIVGGLLREKGVLIEIENLFGTGIFYKGRLDKKKVAEEIFKDKKMRLKLEDILHPLVFEKIDKFIKGIKNKDKIFIVEASLIYERGYQHRFDRIITVFTDEKTAINRLATDNITPAMARQRLRCQLPIKEKIKKADFKIDNNGTLEETRAQVENIYKTLSVEAKINRLISEGRVHEAKRFLERPYYIEGRVIKGAGRGDKLLHTPTANLAIGKFVPLKEGVYAVKVEIVKPSSFSVKLKKASNFLYDGVANIGKDPTFGASAISYEVHIFDFSKNLVGRRLRVHFIKRIRDEKKFPNVKALEKQIKKDIKKAKEILRHEKT